MKIKFVKLPVVLTLILFVIIIVVLLVEGKKILRIGEQVPIDSFSLYVRDYGKGEPAVIIESGLNCSNNWYHDLQCELSKKSRVISYDHAGIGAINYETNKLSISYWVNEFKEKVKGASMPSPNPRYLPYYIKELREMMSYKKLSPPFIFIGHSFGGHILRYYAHLYPDEVAGLVFIDAPHEDWFNYIRKTWSKEEAEDYFKWWDPKINSKNYKGAGLEEWSNYEKNCDIIRGIHIPTNIPVLMFTGYNVVHFRKDSVGRAKDFENWSRLQYAMIADVKTATQIIDKNAGHVFHHDKPEFVNQQINKFIDECKQNFKSQNNEN